MPASSVVAATTTAAATVTAAVHHFRPRRYYHHRPKVGSSQRIAAQPPGLIHRHEQRSTVVVVASTVSPPSSSDASAKIVRIHYHRRGQEYDGFTLHVWGNLCQETRWDAGITPSGRTDWGIFFDVPLNADAVAAAGSDPLLSFIVHKDEYKEATGSIRQLDGGGQAVEAQAFVVEEMAKIWTEQPDLMRIPRGDLGRAKAIWVNREEMGISCQALYENGGQSPESFRHTLCVSRNARLAIGDCGIENADIKVDLGGSHAELSADVTAKQPYLSSLWQIKVPAADQLQIHDLVRSQMAVETRDSNGMLVDCTGVQIHGLLDTCFAYDGPLGVEHDPNSDRVCIRVWAPTAVSVKIALFSPLRYAASDSPEAVLDMYPRADNQAVWEISGPWHGYYYNYRLEVFCPWTLCIESTITTDPYSRSLSCNGLRSHIAYLDDAATKPLGWDTMASAKPALDSFTDISIYELHVRDFSASDHSVPEDLRGTYKAFTLREPETRGVSHLHSLARSGLRFIHLLPTYDFGSVNEDKATWKAPPDLSMFGPSAQDQQREVAEIANEDAYNWGYDPVHFGVPDGSYSTDPDSIARIVEFREMVMALNAIGLRVVIDVVYNHLYSSGPHGPHSVFDKIVPGYYVRRNLDGYIENSTAVNNTASENYMFHRFIVDDLCHWVRDYKVDGFRFDLMGHIMLSTVQQALDKIRSMTVQKDGVDGSKVYFYGEGWDFGEVSLNARGVTACQLNLFGTGIGSFNDRIRSAVLGGSPFGDIQEQGFVTGLSLRPSDNSTMMSPDEQLRKLQRYTEEIMASMAGGLRNFTLEAFSGRICRGEDAGSPGSMCAYCSSPSELINYVSCHDNETLFDSIQQKVVPSMPLEERCRLNWLATSIVALSQGIPFFHAGDELLRSKSLDRDSYNSGDWFNALDFSYSTNNFGVGLPVADKNYFKWDRIQPILEREELKPGREEILSTASYFRELLSIRYSSPLFRLGSAAAIQSCVKFYNTGPAAEPGVIVMAISHPGGFFPSPDPFSCALVVINARPTEYVESSVKFRSEVYEKEMELHPVQRESSDAVVRQSVFHDGSFRVPAYTAAVFVEMKKDNKDLGG